MVPSQLKLKSRVNQHENSKASGYNSKILWAALWGPIVWEEEGPTPILYNSLNDSIHYFLLNALKIILILDIYQSYQS